MMDPQRATELLADVERREVLARTPLVERLSLLGTFDPDRLAGDDIAADVVAHLCAPLKPVDRGPEWTLGERVRVDAWTALLRRGGSALLSLERRTVEPHYDTALQRMLDAFALGGVVPLEARDEEELAASLRVWDWATEAAARAGVSAQVVIGPGRDAIESRLSLLAVTKAVRKLVADGCVGRRSELDRLHEYRTSSTTVGLVGDPPLVVYGIGGVGKSTLLARFVMDLFEASQRGEPNAWAYLDLDRPTLWSYEPGVILDDIIRQVAAQFPAWRRVLRGKQAEAQQRRLGAGLESFDTAFSFHEQAIEFAEDLDRLNGGTLVVVLDTFEEVERRPRVVAEELERLFVVLANELTSLRLIVSGRSPAAVFLDPARADRQLHVETFSGDDALTLLRYFVEREARASAGPVALPDEAFVREIVALVGGNPLTLKLAARVLVAEGPGAVAGAAARAHALDRVRDEFVRGFLYQRVLAHVVGPDPRRAGLLRNVARASLALRSVTPALIDQVILPAIAAPPAADALWLFAALQSEVALAADDRGDLRLREELRGPALAALRLDDLQLVQRVHRAAAAFYARLPDDRDAHVEHLYHRLAAGDPPAAVTLDAPALRELEGALADLPDASADLIRAALHDPATLSEQQEQLAWEQSVAPAIDSALRSGDVDVAHSLLTQRRERSATTELHRLESRLHEAEGDIQRAIAEARRDLAACGVADDPTRYAAAAVRVAALEEQHGRPEEAVEVLRGSAGAPLLAAQWELRLELQLNLMNTLERAGSGGDDEQWLLELDARAYLQRTEPHVVGSSTALIRLLAAAFGRVEPVRIRDAARRIGLGHDEDVAQVHALAAALAEWDAAQPDPGGLARDAGVHVETADPTTLRSAWLNALSGLGTDAGLLLDRLWDTQTPPEPVREAIRMRYLWWGVPQAPAPMSEPAAPGVQPRPSRWWRSIAVAETAVSPASSDAETARHFLDTARLDWTRPEVKRLEQIILAAYPTSSQLQSLLDEAGLDVGDYNWEKARRSTTRDLLGDVGSSGDMPLLIDAVLSDPSVTAFHDPLREVIGHRWLAHHGLAGA